MIQVLIDAVHQNWYVLLIPFIAGIIGYVTNVAAVYLMFHPIDFVGIPPYLGWQGVVPGAAVELAKFSTHLIETRLLKLSDLFEHFDPDTFVSEVRPALEEMVDRTLDDAAQKFAPQMWQNLDDNAKAMVRAQVLQQVEQVARDILADFAENIEDIISLRKIVISTIERNRPLMNEMFLSVGREEFRFVKNSGLWFGFLFGIPQFIVWIFYPKWWILPAAGVLVGYATNWLALKLIFEPKEPKRIGPFVLHGLFHKRQQEVAEEFAATVSQMILYPKNMVDFITNGESREVIEQILRKHFDALIDQYRQHPMAQMIFSQISEDELREEIYGRLDEELTREGGFLWTFVEKSVDVFSELSERMKKLDPEEFEGVLRPAFQKDEWKLIALGAVLGGIAGWMQVVYMFSETLLK
ncbi:MAG: DUF445 family protein [Candidatus Dadabacteria bacterium]|nr:MAG: DUF445 family protein [Candidatus Dadabacteria bacterium]